MTIIKKRSISIALNELALEVKTNAIRNIINQKGEDRLNELTEYSVKEVINANIHWIESFEGIEYWANIYNNIESYIKANDHSGINNFI